MARCHVSLILQDVGFYQWWDRRTLEVRALQWLASVQYSSSILAEALAKPFVLLFTWISLLAVCHNHRPSHRHKP